MYASSGVVCRAFTHDPTYRGWKVTGYKNIRILKTTLTQSHPVQTQLLCTFFARSGTAYSWTGHARVLGEKTWKRDYLTAWFARILCTLQKEVQRSIQVRWRNVSFIAQSFTRAPAVLRVLLFFKRIVRILCFRDYKALRFRDISWCYDWPITSFVNLTWVKSEAQPSFILGGSYHHTFYEELLYQPTADFAEILFISQNGCKLWMAVVVHLANNSPLPRLASWYISGCTLRDLFTFRRLLQALCWFY